MRHPIQDAYLFPNEIRDKSPEQIYELYRTRTDAVLAEFVTVLDAMQERFSTSNTSMKNHVESYTIPMPGLNMLLIASINHSGYSLYTQTYEHHITHVLHLSNRNKSEENQFYRIPGYKSYYDSYREHILAASVQRSVHHGSTCMVTYGDDISSSDKEGSRHVMRRFYQYQLDIMEPSKTDHELPDALFFPMHRESLEGDIFNAVLLSNNIDVVRANAMVNGIGVVHDSCGFSVGYELQSTEFFDAVITGMKGIVRHHERKPES